MDKTVRIWFDAEADFLEVTFSDGPGSTVTTNDDAVMKRVDPTGRRSGFSILGVSQRAKDEHPLEAVIDVDAA